MYRINIRTLLAVVAMTAALTIMTSSVIAGEVFAANGPSSNANFVGQTVGKNGITPNQRYMSTCTQTQSAQQCAINPISGNGAFTSTAAQGGILKKR